MQGTNIAEQFHVVNVLPPRDISGGATGDRFKMTNYGHASIIVQLGVTGAAPTFVVKECNAASAGTATAIAFNVYKEETADGDTLGGRVEVASSGLVASGNDNIFYVIEIDARELSDGYSWIELSATCESAAIVMASAVAVLSGSRYGGDQSATAIA